VLISAETFWSRVVAFARPYVMRAIVRSDMKTLANFIVVVFILVAIVL